MENNRGFVECKNCGSETPKNTRFCVNCGASLAVDTAEKRLEEYETPSQSNGLDRQPEPAGCLAAFLVILVLANGINTVVQMFRFGEVLFDLSPDIAVFDVVAGIAIEVLVLATSASPILFSYAIWKWKRWGMYGFAVLAVINLLIGLHYLDIRSIGGVIRVGILAFLLRDAWHRMT